MNLRKLGFAIGLSLVVPGSSAASSQGTETADVVVPQARHARDQGDMESLQALVRGARDEAMRTNSFDANLRTALLDACLIEAGHVHQNDKLVRQAALDGVA